MEWSKPKPPIPHISPYDHIQLSTPIGSFIIEWKSWKENPDYTITFCDTDWIGCEYSLEDAKKRVKEYLIAKHKELSKYLDL